MIPGNFMRQLLLFLSELFLPRIISSTLESKLAGETGSKAVEVNVSSQPALKLLAGRIETVSATVRGGRWGKIAVDKISLAGEDFRLDMGKLGEEGKLRLNSAKSYSMTGEFTEKNLLDYIRQEGSRLEDIKVRITAEGIRATASAKVFGKKANITIEGIMVSHEGSLYLRTTKAQIENAVPGKIGLEKFFGDVQLVKRSDLPLPGGFTDVTFEDGKIIVTVDGSSLRETK